MTQPRLIAAALLAAGITACVPAQSVPPTAIPIPSSTSTIVPSATAVPSPTPMRCLTEPGGVVQRELQNDRPPQQMLLYLPRCYDEQPNVEYPVLYLLHGQGYQDDQWVRLGAAVAADYLIQSGEAPPFIIVFPDDRYWNLPPGEGFGNRLIQEIIPFVDETYRTLADREHRALGGLSRGGGWAVRYALRRPDLFGTVGLHSPVIFNDDAAVLERLVQDVPDSDWPRIWIDAGDRDGDPTPVRNLEALLTMREVPHEWHIYAGDHSEAYWQAHLVEYLRWYTEGFRQTQSPEPEASATP